MFNFIKSHNRLIEREKDLQEQISYIIWSGQADRLEERLQRLEKELEAVRKELAAF